MGIFKNKDGIFSLFSALTNKKQQATKKSQHLFGLSFNGWYLTISFFSLGKS